MSKIEWTDKTWNPITGCTKVSPGCRRCYAERMATRLRGRHGYPADEPFRVTLHPERLDDPLHWRKPRMCFVCSMSDLFHKDVPDQFIDKVFAVMALAPQHTFQVLTKRPERMHAYMTMARTPLGRSHEVIIQANDRMLAGEGVWPGWPLPNVWLGTSVEDQERADERIPILLETPAAVRFISAEPLLGPIDLRHLQPVEPPTEIDSLAGTHGVLRPHRGQCEGLDWVIVGGESGPGARPMHPDWPLSLRRQCEASGNAYFMKQRGAWAAKSWGAAATGSRAWGTLEANGAWWPETTPWNGRRLNDSETCEEVMVRVGGKGSDPAEWPESLRVREFPVVMG